MGAQFRAYEVPILAAMALVLLAEPLLRRRLHRWQGAACLVLYFAPGGILRPGRRVKFFIKRIPRGKLRRDLQ